MSLDTYVVVEHNQASGQPTGGQSVEFYDDKQEAFDMARELAAESRENGRLERFKVYLLERVEEDEADD